MQRNLRLAMGLAILTVLQGAARAAIPSELTVQGVLRDSTGKLESMSVMVTLNFFDAPTAGNKLNASPYGPTAVMASNGLFTETVTLSAPDLAAISGAAAVFMELQVDADIFARQKIEPEMYALLCQNANQLGGSPASSYLKTSDASAQYQPVGSYAPATGSANYAPATGSANYAPATGSANYAPATGSANYAPATGSANYAPATGSANYAPATGSTHYAPASGIANAALANSSLKLTASNGVSVDGTTGSPQTANLGDTVTFSLDTSLGAGGQILHMTTPTNWAHTAISYNADQNIDNSTAGETALCSSGLTCAGGRTLISGNCITNGGQGGAVLTQSYAQDSHHWCCSWSPTGIASIQYTASVNCL